MSDAIDDPARPPAAQLAWATASALRAGDLRAARRHVEDALGIALQGSRPGSVASVRTILGRVLLAQGALTEAAVHLDEALVVHRHEGNERLVATTQHDRARCLRIQGRIDDALAADIESATLFARLRSSVPEARAHLGIAHSHHAKGQLDAARRHADVAHGVARKASDDTLLGAVLEQIAALDHERGQRRRAAVSYRDAHAAWHRVSDRPGEHRTTLARLRLRFDDDDDVRPHTDALCETLEPTGMRWLEGRALCLHGAALGRAQDRLAYSVLARAASALDSHPTWKHLPALEQGHLDLARGDRDAAMGRLSAVPVTALSAVQVRLAMASLRRSLAVRVS